MPTTVVVRFGARETLPAELSRQAGLRGLTDAQYAKRLILEGLEWLDSENDQSAELGETMDDFFVKNGALYPRE